MLRISRLRLRAFSRAFSASPVADHAHGLHEVHSQFPDVAIPEIPLHDLVFPEFRPFHDKVAIRDGYTDETLKYSELADFSMLFSVALRQQFNFQKHETLSLVSPNHVHIGPILYGAMIAGGRCSPVNPHNTTEEIARQVKDSSSKLLICHEETLEKCQKIAKDLNIPLAIVGNKSVGTAIPSFKRLISDRYLKDMHHYHYDVKRHVCLLPYSSGTTGVPKGTMLTHYNLVSNIMQCLPVEGKFISPGTKCLCPLPLFHIYGLVVALGISMFHGAEVVIMPKFDLQKFCEIIQNQKIERVHAVPPIIVALTKHPVVKNYNLSSLTGIMSGGAPLGAQLQEQCAVKLGNVTVKQGWGMTELSPIGTVVPDDWSKQSYGSVGWLVSNCVGRIANPITGEILPPTSEGEIQIKGPNVMRGYLNREKETFDTITADGFLKTGDVGKFDEHGKLYITDRTKELIKYKGFQVAPAELEAIIGAMDTVEDCLVIPTPDEDAGEIPRAYVKVKAGKVVTEKDIVDHVAERVSPHKKLRGGVVFTNAIPRSPAGKLLRRQVILEDRARTQEKKA